MNGCFLVQDNDPQHSAVAREFYMENDIDWRKTPPESLDLNPIEYIWHELKDYICRVIKPRTKVELECGFLQLSVTVTPQKGCKYISHLNKVIPEVIRCQGRATGY